MAKHLLLSVSFLILTMSVAKSAEIVRSPDCEKAFDCILNMEFELARELINKEKRLNPENLYPHYLANILHYIDYLTSDNQKNLDIATASCTKSIEVFEDEKVDTPLYKALLADLYFQKSVLNGISDNRFSAAVNMYKSYQIIRENEKDYPTYYGNDKLLGIFNITLGPLLANYALLSGLLNIDTNFEDGIQRAEKYYAIAKKDSIRIKEFLLYYGVAFKQAGARRQSMYEKLKENESAVFGSPALVYTYAEFASILKKNDQALAIIQRYEETEGQQPFCQLNYLKGKLLLQSLDNGAEEYLKNYIVNYTGEMFLKQSCLFLAWKSFIDNDTAQMNTYLHKIERIGSTRNSKDRHALNESKDAANWHKNLLKARIFFDGGYFQRALHSMDSIELNTLKNNVQATEYFYRYARIYDAIENKNKAERYYKACIDKGRMEPVYFAANSAFLLAELYLKSGRKVEAKKMIDVCLGISGYDYEREIKYKARQLARQL